MECRSRVFNAAQMRFKNGICYAELHAEMFRCSASLVYTIPLSIDGCQPKYRGFLPPKS